MIKRLPKPFFLEAPIRLHIRQVPQRKKSCIVGPLSTKEWGELINQDLLAPRDQALKTLIQRALAEVDLGNLRHDS